MKLRRGTASSSLPATPAPIVARLNSEINKILAAPDMRAKLADLGYEPIGGTPEEFAAYITREEAKWGKVVKASNLKPLRLRFPVLWRGVAGSSMFLAIWTPACRHVAVRPRAALRPQAKHRR